MYRLNATSYLALTLMGAILLPLTVQASEPTQVKQASFAGTVLEVVPCTNISGSLVTVGSSGSQFIYREGISKSAPTNASPTLGKEVSGVLFASFIDCTVVTGGQTTTVKRQSILYYSSARAGYSQSSQAVTPTPTSFNQSSGGSSSESSFGGFSSLFSKLQGSFSSLFSGSTGQNSSSGASTHTTSNSNSSASSASNTNSGSMSGGASSAGGMGISQPYGGIVLAAIPCTCSGGDFLITLGPPSAGTYLYSPMSAPTMYPYGLVIVPGVHHLGFYRPFGLCWMIAYPCTSIPATKGTITSVGTSLPGK